MVEAGESPIGGKVNLMHKSRRDKIHKLQNEFIGNLQTLNKAAVIGIPDRKLRNVLVTVVNQINREMLREEILPYLAPGSRSVTGNGEKRPNGDRLDIALSQIARKHLALAEVTCKEGAAAIN